jgi:MerR family mercuric resistance operon transcriptional regulator
MPPLRIGKLARLSNVNVQTLRFYERKGLLPKPSRRPSGYREYPPQAIGIVKLIKHVQALGFSLKEIKEFLVLGKKPSTTMATTCGGLERKIDEIDSEITKLTAIRGTLVHMLEMHRQGGDALFAPAFDKHLDRLASEAMARESPERPSARRGVATRRQRPPKTPKAT